MVVSAGNDMSVPVSDKYLKQSLPIPTHRGRDNVVKNLNESEPSIPLLNALSPRIYVGESSPAVGATIDVRLSHPLALPNIGLYE